METWPRRETGSVALVSIASSPSLSPVVYTERIGGTSTCCGPFFDAREALILAAASAAAAAALLLSFAAAVGLRLGLVALSESLRAGERERLSKRLLRGGSGSAWSKRERFLGSSAILSCVCPSVRCRSKAGGSEVACAQDQLPKLELWLGTRRSFPLTDPRSRQLPRILWVENPRIPQSVIAHSHAGKAHAK